MKFKLKKKQKREVKRITEYMISGGAFFWSGYLAFFVIDKLLHGTFFWAKVGATLIGWTVNYLLQRFWVFNNPKLAKHQLEIGSRYVALSVVNLVIDYYLVYFLFKSPLEISPYIGQFISAGFFTVWNYLWYKYWVFPTTFKNDRRRPANRIKKVKKRTYKKA